MIEILLCVLFVWLFFSGLKLAFRVAWGLTKVLAVVLGLVALPLLLVCLLVAGGLALLLPVALVAGAVVLLKLCC